MTGILCVLAGGSGSSATSFNLPVGYGNWSFKGSYLDTYGYNEINIVASTNGPAPTPANYKNKRVMALYSEDSSGVFNIGFAVEGFETGLGVSTIRMGGVDYTVGSPTTSAFLSNTVTFSNSGGSIYTTWNSHGMLEGEMVYFTTSGTLPGGLSPNTIYYVRNPTTNNFFLATVAGGSLIAFSTAGSGTHTGYKKPYTMWQAVSPARTAGNLTGGRTSFNPTISVGSPAVFTFTAHGLTNGKRVILTTGGTLPTGLSPNTIYFVVNAASNTFNVSATQGGSAINTTGAGSGTHFCFEVVDVRVS